MRYVLWCAFLSLLTACTAVDFLGGGPDDSGAAAPTAAEIAAGIKEALAVGSERAVARLGRTDGYWQSAAVRIPVPDKLKKAEKVLRSLGQGRMVDEFHLNLNRAAEQAAPDAAAIFAEAIRGMTLADAHAILTGPDDAATAYFRAKTSGAIATAFRPVVARVTNAGGVTRRYKEMVGKAGRFSSFDPKELDLDAYVTERALAGLFFALAEEERKIRADPAARSTELLNRVFSGR